MRDEHFGICLVEYMMAGLVVIGHKSGGPYTDIVNTQNKQTNNDNHQSSDGNYLQSDRGYLCETKEEYAQCFADIFSQFDNGNGLLKMRQNARNFVITNYSLHIFKQNFVNCVLKVF